jgi:spore coat polysaccharide biosynthesis protein SpsF
LNIIVGAIIQARMTSTRLPGKVARELPYGSGVTVLEQVVRRLKRCRAVDRVVVATTTDKADSGLAGLARKAGAGFFRGSREDVLSRYLGAAKKYRCGVIVRITSDCPCVDPRLVDSLVRAHLKSGADYTSNVVTLTYPDGYDVEVLNLAALERAHAMARPGTDREHVTSYLRGNPGVFKLNSVEAPAEYRRPDLRITLDTPEDYALLCTVYDALYPSDKFFGIAALFRLFRRKPWLEAINRRSLAKKVFTDERAELKEAVAILKLQELRRAAALLEKCLGKKH